MHLWSELLCTAAQAVHHPTPGVPFTWMTAWMVPSRVGPWNHILNLKTDTLFYTLRPGSHESRAFIHSFSSAVLGQGIEQWANSTWARYHLIDKSAGNYKWGCMMGMLPGAVKAQEKSLQCSLRQEAWRAYYFSHLKDSQKLQQYKELVLCFLWTIGESAADLMSCQPQTLFRVYFLHPPTSC